MQGPMPFESPSTVENETAMLLRWCSTGDADVERIGNLTAGLAFGDQLEDAALGRVSWAKEGLCAASAKARRHLERITHARVDGNRRS